MASSEIQQCISLSGKLSRRMDLIFLVFGFFFLQQGHFILIIQI